ncbi:hypothetical protein NDU88_000044 [Pleurodeles waltl]|uniref:Uncharacterized protein n=1 Tax=Pleurodeles waltl TaxID=8319 RepID=A0AAV7VUU1_PLEWA|nr:hypothetical protein NDU88_000044 [Pleurodeles waltl]
METEWNATSGEGGGTESRKPLSYGDSTDYGGVSEVRREPVVNPKTREGTPKTSEQRAPGGAWLAQKLDHLWERVLAQPDKESEGILTIYQTP